MKFLKIFTYNIFITFFIIFILIFFIFLIELFSGRYLSNNKLDCSYILCNANYNYINRSREEVLKENYEVFYEISYQKDEYGFRGRRKDVSRIDILTIGGSTTDEKFLNLNDTWSEQLEKNFVSRKKDIDVVNAGIDGQSSFGHIWSLKNWLPKIKNFRTKYIIFYMGINETLENEGSNHQDLINKNLDKKNKIKFYIQRNDGFIYNLYNFFSKKYYNLYLNKGYHILLPQYSKMENIFTPTSEQKLNLRKNLIQMYELTKDLNAIPVFVTQRTSYWKKINNEILSDNINNRNKDYYNYEKFISNTIIEFCEENNIFCIDTFNNLEYAPEDHFELTHTTSKGSSKIANYVFEEIQKKYDF